MFYSNYRKSYDKEYIIIIYPFLENLLKTLKKDCYMKRTPKLCPNFGVHFI